MTIFYLCCSKLDHKVHSSLRTVPKHLYKIVKQKFSQRVQQRSVRFWRVQFLKSSLKSFEKFSDLCKIVNENVCGCEFNINLAKFYHRRLSTVYTIKAPVYYDESLIKYCHGYMLQGSFIKLHLKIKNYTISLTSNLKTLIPCHEPRILVIIYNYT